MTSSSTLTTFRYARTMYAPRAARIWHLFILVQTYVEKPHFLVKIDGFHAMSHIRFCHVKCNETSKYTQIPAKYWVRFHEVGYGKPAYSVSIGRIFLRTLCARISRVLRVRRPEARRWNGRDLHFPKLCMKLKNIEIKSVCTHHTFRLLLTVINTITFEKCLK